MMGLSQGNTVLDGKEMIGIGTTLIALISIWRATVFRVKDLDGPVLF
jgi:hypothetical protein